ncbi:hypothetical protein [Demequina pelophila]|uniref:hypothetical protein n=1 Tax=Demequina pelophila TaxID=1638984 RepID=UPI000782028E|nr:hypothetical protein [Demequina pelophila]
MPETTTPARPEIGVRPRRAVMWTLLLTGATVMLLAIAPTFGLWTLLLGPAAAAAAITSLVLLRGTRGIAGLRVMLVFAIAIGLFGLLYGGGVALLREPLADFAACQSRALTSTAERACLDQFEEDYLEVLERYGVVLPATETTAP